MAIAAADTIKRHFDDLKIKPDYYDLILTGDLGVYGKEILIEYLKDLGVTNYQDIFLKFYDMFLGIDLLFRHLYRSIPLKVLGRDFLQ